MGITLLDIAKANGSDAVVGLVDEAAALHPEISGMSVLNGQQVSVPGVGDARTISGLNYKTLVRTGLPTVSFRAANQGTASSKSTHANRMVETFILNPRWNADKAVADAYEDGAEAYIAMEGAAHMEAAMQHLGKQFYYGTNATNQNDALGHPGLIQAYDATNMAVDAGGTTASTGSSVWAVKWGPKAVRWVWGRDGQLELSDVDMRDVSDGSNNYTAYHQELLARPGLQVGSIRAIGRIKKLTEDSGKGLTDALISSLLSKFRSGYYPDVLFMSRRSLTQLQQSRTATNPTGAPAPFPQSAFGVPILPTDSILDTEELTL